MSLSSIHRSRKWPAYGLLALLLVGLGAACNSFGSASTPLQDPAASVLMSASPASAPLGATSAPPVAHLAAGAVVRSGPGDHYLIFSITETGEDYPVLGRSRDGQWWRIDYRGLPAWVAAAQAETQAADAPIVQVGGERL
mgnify:CR=1 FL=1